MIRTALCRYLKRGFMALSDAPDHKQRGRAVLRPPILPVRALQPGAVHVQSQALRGDADGNAVPVSIGETKERDPAHRISQSFYNKQP